MEAAKKILVVEDDRPLRHALCKLLEGAGFSVTGLADGVEALSLLRRRKFDLAVLDIGLPHMNGLEIVAHLPAHRPRPKIIIMTANDTPQTMLRAVREQAYRYITKPFPPNTIVELVKEALAASPALAPIEVLSAKPEWVELLVPCEIRAADVIQGVMERLEADLPQQVRESVTHAFSELLQNAIEWGGQLDPNRKVRISFLRTRRILIYRIADPGPGFDPESLTHAAITNPPGQPLEHLRAREQKGLRPGGFGLLMVQGMVDELLYNEAHNEVVFLKYLE